MHYNRYVSIVNGQFSVFNNYSSAHLTILSDLCSCVCVCLFTVFFTFYVVCPRCNNILKCVAMPITKSFVSRNKLETYRPRSCWHVAVDVPDGVWDVRKYRVDAVWSVTVQMMIQTGSWQIRRSLSVHTVTCKIIYTSHYPLTTVVHVENQLHSIFSARQHICTARYRPILSPVRLYVPPSVRPSVRPSVCHTSGSVNKKLSYRLETGRQQRISL